MESFIEAVRNRKIKGPQQRGFHLNVWNNAFEQISSGSAEDVELHLSGLWFDTEFIKIRSITDHALASFGWSSPQDRLCAFVGYAVLQWTILINSTRKQMEKGKLEPHFLTEFEQIPVNGPFVNVVDPAGTIESIVDGLRFPLSLPHESTPSHVAAGHGGFKELAAFTHLVFTGQYYHVLEQHWLDCLWNDYRVLQDSRITQIAPRDNKRANHEAVSKFRKGNLMHEATYYAASFWEHRLSNKAKHNFLSTRNVLSVYKRHGRFRVKAAPAARFPDRAKDLGFFRMALTAEHTDALLNENFAALHGLTVAQVLTAYELISHFPNQVLNFLPNDNGIKQPEELVRWAPVFCRSELITALKDAMQLDAATAEWLITRMTFTRSVRDDLWFQPFVSLSADDVTLVVPAVHGVNFARLLERILREVPEAEAKAGFHFEAFIHEKFKKEALGSPLASLTQVCSKPSMLVRTQEVEEEVDFAFMLGNQLFVCELKATKFPCEPLEHLNYRRKLDEAAKQVIRKVGLVRANLGGFLSEAGISFAGSLSEVSVLPLIISSSALFSGWTWQGVPVCDWFILRCFFVEGELGLLAMSGETGELRPGAKHKFYNSAEDAVQSAFQYFCHAPQVMMFEPFINVLEIPLPAFGPHEVRKVFVSPYVQLPHDALRDLAERLHKSRARRQEARVDFTLPNQL